MSKQSILIRYNNPTKYDLAPYKSIWKVSIDKEKSYYYIQLSEDETISKWMEMGDFLAKAFCAFFGENHPRSEKFIDHCCELYYNQSKENPISAVRISNIIQ